MLGGCLEAVYLDMTVGWYERTISVATEFRVSSQAVARGLAGQQALSGGNGEGNYQERGG